MIVLINQVLWTVATVMILVSGLYFSFKFSFLQLNFKKMFKSLFKKNKKEGISPFSALMMSLAGRIGVGSIAGVALAIYVGGAGSIFWMWIISIFGAINTFLETLLGNVYKKKDESNIYVGGPSYYMKYGLGLKKMGIFYAVVVIVSYIGGFLGIQANTITKSLGEIVSVNEYLVGFILILFTALIIFGGVKKIAAINKYLVPIMTIIYLLVAIYVVTINIHIFPKVLLDIITSAFNFKSIISGFIPMFIIGIQRGIFSNEAGLGTGSIASSITNSDDSVSLSYVQTIGIYITTFIICTATAFIILTSNYQALNLVDVNGIEITQYAFNYHLPNFGNIIVFMSILLFSYSTILTGYYYGESNLKFIFGKVSRRSLVILKLVSLAIIYLGCIMPSTTLWQIVDIMVAILAITNITALILLRNTAAEELQVARLKS